MRFWDAVADLPPARQLALVTDLTLGCGQLTLASRLHQADGRTTTVLGALAAAHRALTAALVALAPATPDTEAAATAVAAPGSGQRPALGEVLPQRWGDLVVAAPPGEAHAWLQRAMQASADAARAALDNADCVSVCDHLAQALQALGTLRDTVACAAPLTPVRPEVP